MIIENMKELEKLASLLGFFIETDNNGQIVLYTNLTFDDNNELIPFECVHFKPENQEDDVHTEHCCILHGCKYGNRNDDCTVVSEQKIQSFPCEYCEPGDTVVIRKGK